ncbi:MULTISPECIES: hypothetical protein [unclassified Microcoleus]|uniref:hypothetical protein n=1 Tax=unclassified Microcoleus TaxID=2642155 RepID=UPI0025F16FBA|nr:MULTISPECIES: hypothetical protein [unclassified Microcoleus]
MGTSLNPRIPNRRLFEVFHKSVKDGNKNLPHYLRRDWHPATDANSGLWVRHWQFARDYPSSGIACVCPETRKAVAEFERTCSQQKRAFDAEVPPNLSWQ